MEAVRIEATIQPNGRIVLENLPFVAGDKVEIIILEANGDIPHSTTNPLKGTLLKYDDPFGPAVPLEDWEALK